MLTISPKCSECSKEIQSNEEVHVKMRYPRIKAVTEIKAYLQNEGIITCVDCMNKKMESHEKETI